MLSKMWRDASMLQALSLEQALSGNWLPVVIERHNQEVYVKWCLLKGLDFSAPFLSDSLRKLSCRYELKEVLRYSSVSSFLEYERNIPRATQDTEGCLFHISRCGSTLLCNTLKKSPASLVLSEPQPLDFILRTWSCKSVNTEQQDLVLKALFSLWNFVAQQQGKKLFVKPDCWLNLHWKRLYQAASPRKSWFLTRDLTEVLLSHKKLSGAFLLPQYVSAAYFGLEEPGNEVFNYSGYPLDVLLKILDSGQALLKNTDTELLDYEGLVPDGLLRVLSAHQISLSEEQLNSVLARHSKNGGQFTAESKAQSDAFSDETRHLIKVKQRGLVNFN